MLIATLFLRKFINYLTFTTLFSCVHFIVLIEILYKVCIVFMNCGMNLLYLLLTKLRGNVITWCCFWVTWSRQINFSNMLLKDVYLCVTLLIFNSLFFCMYLATVCRSQNERFCLTTRILSIISGESAVGKSSLVLRFVKGQFHEYQESTIGGIHFFF